MNTLEMETTLETPALSLSGIIQEEILKNGPVSFYDFMKMALYYPGIGYYTSEGIKIGPEGDYYTSPVITPIFGELIGKQLEEMWLILGKEPFTIVEYGAGQGSLCRDILFYLRNNADLYKNLSYYIIEKKDFVYENEKVFAPGKVHLVDGIHAIAPFSGCILSNELLDNFPVHRVVMKENLMEVFVDYDRRFVEVLKPASKAVKKYFSALNITLPEGFCTEVNLEAIDWIREIAPALQKGFVFTIDYGYPSAELYRGDKSGGTLMCYRKHRINDNPYNNIGHQDITSHVNFSALCYWGVKNGLDYIGFTRQSHFLLSLGLNDYIKNIEGGSQDKYFNPKQKEFFINTFLRDMGSKLKVLIQQKGICIQHLSGLKFSLKSML